MISGQFTTKDEAMALNAINRLKRTAIKTEAATDVKGAAAAIQKIFELNKFNFKVKAKAPDKYSPDGYIFVSGKTDLGLVEFYISLDDDRQNLYFDWESYDGLILDEKEIIPEELEYMVIPEGTKKYDLDEYRKDVAKMPKGLVKLKARIEDLSNKVKKVEALNVRFLRAMDQIAAVIKENRVRVRP